MKINIIYSVLLIYVNVINISSSLPILPIITAIGGTSSNILNVDIDSLGIAKWISESIKLKKNRSGFVKDLMYTAFYKSDQKYNVLVFNLNEEHKHKLKNIEFYASTEYTDGTKFGIWVFESGFFMNKGARGWDNWAMIGSFTKNRTGNVVTFRKRVHQTDNNTRTQLDLKNIFCDIND